MRSAASQWIAITRGVSPAIADCELTHLDRRPIDFQTARAQHHAYQETLRALGCEVLSLPPDPALPDSVFVEDTAVVLDELAVLTRPGAPSRRPETAATADALRPYRPLVRIAPPGSMDGGDVLRVGRTVYVGLTARTNQAAIDQLATSLSPHDYVVRAVPVRGCLHLKSAVTQVAAETLLCNARWVDPAAFAPLHVLEVERGEPYAANGLLIEGRVLYPTTFPATRRRLEGRGIAVVLVDVSELQKAEGAVTCCSLVFEAARVAPALAGR
jgi:dimethylargininase